jgi:hypothetical protein
MATTTESIRPREFEDSIFQRLFDLLRNAAHKPDNKMKVTLLHSLAKQAEELATELSRPSNPAS